MRTKTALIERHLPDIFKYKEILVYNPDQHKPGINWISSDEARKLAKALVEAADRADGLI